MFRVTDLLASYWEMVKKGVIMSEYPELLDSLYPPSATEGTAAGSPSGEQAAQPESSP
ncbi:MAG: hypothetical protein ACYCVB_08140 [Bacilli bacterium]